MQLRLAGVVFAFVIFISSSDLARGQKEGQIVEGSKLGKLIEALKAAKTVDEKSNLAYQIAEERDAAAVPILVASLKDKDRVIRMNIAGALRTMGPAAKTATPALIAALKDTDDRVRTEVIGALGSIRSNAEEVIPLISDILKNPAENDNVRAAAASSLGWFGAAAKNASPVLTNTLQDKDALLRVASATALRLIDKENTKIVVPALREVLKDKDERARTRAVLALKAIGPDAKEAVPDLMATLAKGGMPAYYAREALGRIPEAEPALVAALADPDKNLQQTAAGVLTEYFPKAAAKAGLGKK